MLAVLQLDATLTGVSFLLGFARYEVTAQQPLIEQSRQLIIVQVLHQKMRIAIDADFGQFYQCRIASVPVD